MKRVLILTCVAIGWNPGDAVRAADGPLVLDVWPGEAVGDDGQIGPERARSAAEAPTKDAKWITNVTRPTISVFRPDAGANARVAAVICPGGGYWNLAWDKEGEEVAAWLNALGITGVVLKYRVPRRPGEPEPLPAPGPLLDARRAIRLVRSRAGEWGIDPERIGIMGFSAGGHLAVETAISFERPSYGPIDEVDRASCRPDFAVVAYPGYIIEFSGSDPHSGQVDYTVAQMGVDRLVWGGHGPTRSHSTELSKVLDADLDDAQRRQIFGVNLRRIAAPIFRRKGYPLDP
jgi:hypothetical protein